MIKRILAYRKHPLSLLLLLMIYLSIAITLVVLVTIIAYILIKGIPNITFDLFSLEYTSKNVSMFPSIINTIIIVLLTLLIALPFGIFSAIYLVEYANNKSYIIKIIRMTTEILSGIPSIVYGLFGFLLFTIRFHWGYSIIAGACTLSIMVLPIIIRTTEEALHAVSNTYREGSYGLGAGKLRTIFKIVLPSATPGILAGIILSIGRIVGESAALLYTAGSVASIPEDLFSSGRTLSVHMYALLSEGLYLKQAYATAVVLLIIIIGINYLSSLVVKLLTKGYYYE